MTLEVRRGRFFGHAFAGRDLEASFLEMVWGLRQCLVIISEPVRSDTAFRKPRQHRNCRLWQRFNIRQESDSEELARPAGKVDRGTRVARIDGGSDSSPSSDRVGDKNSAQRSSQRHDQRRIGHYLSVCYNTLIVLALCVIIS